MLQQPVNFFSYFLFFNLFQGAVFQLRPQGGADLPPDEDQGQDHPQPPRRLLRAMLRTEHLHYILHYSFVIYI